MIICLEGTEENCPLCNSFIEHLNMQKMKLAVTFNKNYNISTAYYRLIMTLTTPM